MTDISFSCLAVELRCLIYGFLDPKELGQVEAVCREWQTVITSPNNANQLWQRHVLQALNVTKLNSRKVQACGGYRQLYHGIARQQKLLDYLATHASELNRGMLALTDTWSTRGWKIAKYATTVVSLFCVKAVGEGVQQLYVGEDGISLFFLGGLAAVAGAYTTKQLHGLQQSTERRNAQHLNTRKELLPKLSNHMQQLAFQVREPIETIKDIKRWVRDFINHCHAQLCANDPLLKLGEGTNHARKQAIFEQLRITLSGAFSEAGNPRSYTPLKGGTLI